jgi:hypothetical protein
MEAINAIFHLADLAGVLSSLRASAIRHRVSLYIDDLVVFIDPTELDLTVVRAIMEMFADASSLRTNVGKCQIMPICCSNEQVTAVQSWFPAQVMHFLCKYLKHTALSVCSQESGLDAIGRCRRWPIAILESQPHEQIMCVVIPFALIPLILHRVTVRLVPMVVTRPSSPSHRHHSISFSGLHLPSSSSSDSTPSVLAYGRACCHTRFLRTKPDAHRMYAQDQVVTHTVRM